MIKKSSLSKVVTGVAVLAMTSLISPISAIANDISFDEIFSFQIEKLCKKNDLLFLFSVLFIFSALHSSLSKALSSLSNSDLN